MKEVLGIDLDRATHDLSNELLYHQTTMYLKMLSLKTCNFDDQAMNINNNVTLTYSH